MKYFKELDLPYFDLYSEYKKLLSEEKIYWSTNQISITTTKDKPDDFIYGCGSLDLDWSNAKEYTDENGETQMDVPQRVPALKESDFTEVVEVFKNTLFEDCVTEIRKNYTTGRIRLMQNHTRNCMSWHYDYSQRIHYPLKTQEGCIMVIEDEVKHLDANKWWQTDTTKMHTAFNGSRSNRIHLVVNLL